MVVTHAMNAPIMDVPQMKEAARGRLSSSRRIYQRRAAANGSRGRFGKVGPQFTHPFRQT
jgi:hypothetical protein